MYSLGIDGESICPPCSLTSRTNIELVLGHNNESERRAITEDSEETIFAYGQLLKRISGLGGFRMRTRRRFMRRLVIAPDTWIMVDFVANRKRNSKYPTNFLECHSKQQGSMPMKWQTVSPVETPRKKNLVMSHVSSIPEYRIECLIWKQNGKHYLGIVPGLVINTACKP